MKEVEYKKSLKYSTNWMKQDCIWLQPTENSTYIDLFCKKPNYLGKQLRSAAVGQK